MTKLSNSLSIIIPTYQEANNIPLLVDRIANLELNFHSLEVLLVDDNSEDGSQEIVQSLSISHPWLKLITRRDNHRSWAKSILHGIHAAQFPILVFMDADLSHPPETIPEMLRLLTQTNTDLVIGSRHTEGGSTDKAWPLYRKLVSRLATLAIKPLLPKKIKDPLSGFIAIKKQTLSINGHLYNPIGTKLALEIIVKSKIKNIVEVPICFEQRKHGESKLMTMKMALNYARQIQQLWKFKLLGI